MNRSTINQALSKSLAYKAAGKHAAANYWAGVLVKLLEAEGIVPDPYLTPSQVDASSRPVNRQSFDSYFTQP